MGNLGRDYRCGLLCVVKPRTLTIQSPLGSINGGADRRSNSKPSNTYSECHRRPGAESHALSELMNYWSSSQYLACSHTFYPTLWVETCRVVTVNGELGRILPLARTLPDRLQQPQRKPLQIRYVLLPALRHQQDPEQCRLLRPNPC